MPYRARSRQRLRLALGLPAGVGMSRGTTHRTVRIEDGLWLSAKAKAEAESRNLSDVIRDALRAYVAEDGDS